MDKKYLSRRELSQCLGVSLSTVARMWKKKEFPFNCGIKVGRRVLFPLSCVSSIQQTCSEQDTRADATTSALVG